MHLENLKIGVIGLGYVGLPIAVEFAKKYDVVGYDINASKIEKLKKNIDPSKEIPTEILKEAELVYTHNKEDLSDCNFFVIAVPTPVDKYKVPNLTALKSASQIVSEKLTKGDYVVFESTVFPGCTEEICIPILESSSGLTFKKDFKVGYSPERINPGDTLRTLTKIIKVVSGCDEESLEFIAETYSSIIEAGVFKASSIKVAEASKVIENTQRDLNIALMNELAIIFDKLDINTRDVLAAAGTKWNFLKFHPGLVGGHCIDIDPYYLTYQAEQNGYTPEVILSGRKINSHIPRFIVEKIVHALLNSGKKLSECRTLIKGLTFKENVSDIRNSRVFDLVTGLQHYLISTDVEDPHVDPQELVKGDVNLITKPTGIYDVLILAVSHNQFVNESLEDWKSNLAKNAIIFDVKSSHGELLNVEDIDYMSL
ncbi:MAG: nucleotide sugar dehydrogenase [Saprospiraceae bacterium]|nr:nucleotide sugar dehydrogenase [Saprospiraceae bacterium]